MPGVRTRGQTLIGCWCDENFVAIIDEARGHTSRSQFARDALREKLAKMGITVVLDATIAPDRTGKGGPKPRRAGLPNYALNDKPAASSGHGIFKTSHHGEAASVKPTNSVVSRKAKSLAKTAASKVRTASPGHSPKPQADEPNE